MLIHSEKMKFLSFILPLPLEFKLHELQNSPVNSHIRNVWRNQWLETKNAA